MQSKSTDSKTCKRCAKTLVGEDAQEDAGMTNCSYCGAEVCCDCTTLGSINACISCGKSTDSVVVANGSPIALCADCGLLVRLGVSEITTNGPNAIATRFIEPVALKFRELYR